MLKGIFSSLTTGFLGLSASSFPVDALPEADDEVDDEVVVVLVLSEIVSDAELPPKRPFNLSTRKVQG